jgi:hypothetical protein
MNILKEINKRKWNALTEVKKFLETHSAEKVISFNGYQLITTNYIFGLANNTVSVRNNNDSK